MKTGCASNVSAPFAGDNLLLLMGLPADSAVLIIGDRLDSWGRLFRNCRVSAHIPDRSAGTEPCCLVLYHSTSADDSRAFATDMNLAREILAENGSILVFAENPTSFRNLRQLKLGKLGSLLGKLRFGHSCYEQQLHQSGFGDVRCFYSLPNLEQAEELVTVGSRLLELPHYWHSLLHAANKLGLFRKLAEGVVYHASSIRLESGELLDRINAEVKRQTSRPQVYYDLERIDIRARGALVLFLMNVGTGDRLVARIVSDTKIDQIVRKNHDFLESLHTASGLSSSFRKMLPLPLCRMEYSGSAVYVETMVEGLPAWKVNRQNLKKRILQDSVGFLIQLNHATSQVTRLGEHVLDELFKADLIRIMSSEVIESTFKEKLVLLINSLIHRLTGRNLNLTTSHGDYGYGNILVDPESGALKGVIDWDTARKSDYPGIDMFNLFVQKVRAEKNCRPLEAFSVVIAELAADGPETGHTFFQQELGLVGDLRLTALYLCFLRYTTRALQYPDLFVDEQDDFCSILDLLQDTLPL